MLEPDVASKMSRLDVCSLQSVTLKSSRQFDSGKYNVNSGFFIPVRHYCIQINEKLQTLGF